eukprot:TRINITY_DN4446_c0_g1_i3.p1 TRINITY_DN4446_c0_g1~~TRINITY_DN4446_c0_g1_i3.p1  ORF type:complete len:577 (+),score=121.02 TRINITY_DN4446_c0_g1_i3:67-1797(+)
MDAQQGCAKLAGHLGAVLSGDDVAHTASWVFDRHPLEVPSLCSVLEKSLETVQNSAGLSHLWRLVTVLLAPWTAESSPDRQLWVERCVPWREHLLRVWARPEWAAGYGCEGERLCALAQRLEDTPANAALLARWESCEAVPKPLAACLQRRSCAPPSDAALADFSAECETYWAMDLDELAEQAEPTPSQPPVTAEYAPEAAFPAQTESHPLPAMALPLDAGPTQPPVTSPHLGVQSPVRAVSQPPVDLSQRGLSQPPVRCLSQPPVDLSQRALSQPPVDLSQRGLSQPPVRCLSQPPVHLSQRGLSQPPVRGLSQPPVDLSQQGLSQPPVDIALPPCPPEATGPLQASASPMQLTQPPIPGLYPQPPVPDSGPLPGVHYPAHRQRRSLFAHRVRRDTAPQVVEVADVSDSSSSPQARMQSRWAASPPQPARPPTASNVDLILARREEARTNAFKDHVDRNLQRHFLRVTDPEAYLQQYGGPSVITVSDDDEPEPAPRLPSESPASSPDRGRSRSRSKRRSKKEKKRRREGSVSSARSRGGKKHKEHRKEKKRRRKERRRRAASQDPDPKRHKGSED